MNRQPLLGAADALAHMDMVQRLEVVSERVDVMPSFSLVHENGVS